MMKKALFSMMIAFVFMPFFAKGQTQLNERIEQPKNAVVYVEEYKACDTFLWNRNKKVYRANTVDTCKISEDTFYVLNLAIFKSNKITLTPYATCDYTWKNKTYTSDATIKDTLKNIHQCDSIVTVVLHLTKTNYDTTVVRTCRAFTFGGEEYTNSGIFDGYKTRNTTLNCDSVHRLDLTIENKVQRWERVTQCEQFTWSIDNVTYTKSAIVDSNVTGDCDSIIHLIYTKTDLYDTVVATACEKYSFRGKTYTTSGFKDDTTIDAKKCRTIHTANLTIITPRDINNTIRDTACTAYQHNFEKFADSRVTRVITIYDSVTKKTTTVKTSAMSASTTHSSLIEGKYTNHTSPSQCYDSTIVIHITINNTNHVVEEETACDRYVWNWKASEDPNAATKKITFTKTGSDSIAVGKNVHKCDSFLVKKVTINVSPVIESIQGKYKMLDGESVKLYAKCDQEDVKYKWMDGSKTLSTKDTLESDAFNKNTDVTLIVTNKKSGCADTSWITVLYGVGIDEVENVNLTLAPNPTAGNIVINCGEEMHKIFVYNTMGQEIMTQMVSGNVANINVANLSKSVYTVRIELANGKQMVRQIIKNR